ncbi:aminotransferase class I/II-fold pyridoxal phosphate-dependent enzyme [Sessilibacter corallicola]|uniref:Aminotransferase class I/II-fold pyridoxal phosphate-dependent enzyme n=1 Tax=Sessilibacter corallicola TaxID=2904075 RepID=A0ABQ0A6T8_9GAMM|nr:aminotransferase class I/II-fold pyridoxal phosphate-dependent enzyme [Sessilibacter corallicola]MCE2028532.1 aminotransferase class I/II-fold pyridoxal phosphate-dependent enzyme [Sessilibacter corallicola]
MNIQSLSTEQLQSLEQELTAEYKSFQAQDLKLDLTRGKPSSEQLSLSDSLDGILTGNYKNEDGTDTRNYGGIDGIIEMKRLGAAVLGVEQNEILVGGNASLTLMYQCVLQAYLFGFDGPDSAWNKEEKVKFACPVPGYDRHFSICEAFGIEMVNVPMTDTGPDIEALTDLVKSDPSVKGIWCVPKYSNPTGIIYSDETVAAIAGLANIAGPNFKVFWDNAYIVHDLVANPGTLANVMASAKEQGTQDSILQFCSTSKITHAGAGVAFLNATEKNLATFKKSLGIATIGPDKINQLRHAILLPNMDALAAHMRKHAEILKPRFDLVLSALQEAFGDNDLGSWESPEGGYFISFDTQPGLAKEVVSLAGQAGVKLTPAGATFPYGEDPNDQNIRIAPSVPTLQEVESAMQIFVNCVKLATVRKALA